MLAELKRKYWQALEYPSIVASRALLRLDPQSRAIATGLASHFPSFGNFSLHGVIDSSSARSCYSVWLRHLTLAVRNGLGGRPSVLAELGPGNSLGVGIAALLSGVDQYLALDVVPHTRADQNLPLLEELVKLYRARVPIPDAKEFPSVKPYLESYEFPESLLSMDRLDAALGDGRVERIRFSLMHPEHPESMIQYRAPWLDARILEPDSVDMILSQAVMEHVDDLEGAYGAMRHWLRPGGVVSHQIDFKCHGLATEWNGHWRYSDLAWKVIRGRRPFLLNREPASTHLRLLARTGFRVVDKKSFSMTSSLGRMDLARRFRGLSEDDLTTSGLFVQAVRE